MGLTGIEQWMLYLANSLNIVADMTIAISQMWFFYRSRTGIKKSAFAEWRPEKQFNRPISRSDSIINLLILYSVNTGLLTGAFSIVELVVVRVQLERSVAN